MALGFTSHYKSSEQAFGSLTQSSYNNDVESSGTEAYVPSLILGHDSSLSIGMVYDSCEFSTSVTIDYSQYANIAFTDGGASETAGSIAYSGSDTSVSNCAVSSFSTGGVSFSGGGGMSCASFTC